MEFDLCRSSFRAVLLVMVMLLLFSGLHAAPLINDLPDSAFSSSTSVCDANPTRTSCCNDDAKMTDNTGQAWCAGTTDASVAKYVTVDLQAAYTIAGIATAGRLIFDDSCDQWVTSYDFSYSLDGVTFTTHGTFAGNSNKTTIRVHNLYPDNMVFARYVRFTVNSYYGWPSMRVEVYSYVDSFYAASLGTNCPDDVPLIGDEAHLSFDLRTEFDNLGDIFQLTHADGSTTRLTYDSVEQQFHMTLFGQDMGFAPKLFTVDANGLSYFHKFYLSQTAFVWKIDWVTMLEVANPSYAHSVDNSLCTFVDSGALTAFTITAGDSPAPTAPPTPSPTPNGETVYIWEEYGYYMWKKAVTCTASKDDSTFVFYDTADFPVMPTAIKFAPSDDLYDDAFVVQSDPNADYGGVSDHWLYRLKKFQEVSCAWYGSSSSPSPWCLDGDVWTGTDEARARAISEEDVAGVFYCDPSGGEFTITDNVVWKNDTIFMTNDGIGISPVRKMCVWEKSSSTLIDRDIDVYLGWAAADTDGYATLESGTITIRACYGWTYAPGALTLKMQLKGEDGASHWFYVNAASALPTNGDSASFTFDIEHGAYAVNLYSVMLALDDTNGYCFRSIHVVYSTQVNFAFAADHFGSGLVLASECGYNFVGGIKEGTNDDVYVQCVPDFLELFVYKQRGIETMAIHSCIGADSGIASSSMKNNLYAALMGKVDGYSAYETGPLTLLYSADDWPADTYRIFELNSDVYMDEVIVAAIGNTNDTDVFCMDSVMIDQVTSARHISHTHIGGGSASAVSVSIFQYPVCATEVLSMSIDYDESQSYIIPEDSTITGLECKNENRVISSACSISQSFELSKVTSFSISSEDEQTKEYSWGSSTSTSFLTGWGSESLSETSSTNEFSFGFEQSVSAGVDAFGVSAEVSVGANQQWTSSSTTTSGNSHSNYGEQSQASEQSQSEGASTSVINGAESSFETSTTTSIECTASMQVPPSHSVSYSLVFNAFNTTIRTYTDLKLTLCSAFLHDDAGNVADDSEHVIYVDNIPGQLYHKEITACNVQFDTAEYLRNDMGCVDEQALAISAGSTYIPQCREGEPALYDGCQCNTGDLDSLASCWCVDATGNLVGDGGAHNVDDGTTWQQYCVETLNCSDSAVVYAPDAAAFAPAHWFYLVVIVNLAILFAVALVYLACRVFKNSNAQWKQVEMYSHSDMDDV